MRKPTDEELRALWIDYCLGYAGREDRNSKWFLKRDKWRALIERHKMIVREGTIQPSPNYYYTLTNGKTYRTDEPL